jgi:hypothetical protein
LGGTCHFDRTQRPLFAFLVTSWISSTMVDLPLNDTLQPQETNAFSDHLSFKIWNERNAQIFNYKESAYNRLLPSVMKVTLGSWRASEASRPCLRLPLSAAVAFPVTQLFTPLVRLFKLHRSSRCLLYVCLGRYARGNSPYGIVSLVSYSNFS